MGRRILGIRSGWGSNQQYIPSGLTRSGHVGARILGKKLTKEADGRFAGFGQAKPDRLRFA